LKEGEEEGLRRTGRVLWGRKKRLRHLHPKHRDEGENRAVSLSEEEEEKNDCIRRKNLGKEPSCLRWIKGRGKNADPSVSKAKKEPRASLRRKVEH